MGEKPFVDIVILNFNREQDTAECILSLARMDYKDYRVIVVDNGSSDGSGSRLKQRFGKIELIRSEANLGFAGGCNVGMTHSMRSGKAAYLLLLNSDAIAGERLLDALTDVAAMDPTIGIVGAINYYYDQPSKVHQAWHSFIWPLGGIAGRGYYPFTAPAKDVQSVPGSCMLIKREVLAAAGLFDERFFAYYEDSDLCLRARRAAFRVVVAAGAKIWHKLSKVVADATPGEQYIYARNQPLFMLKNCPAVFLPLYFARYFLRVTLGSIYCGVTGKARIAHALMRGCSDFMRNRFGEGALFALSGQGQEP